MEQRAGRFGGLVLQLSYLQRAPRRLSRRSVRAPCLSRQGYRQGTPCPSRKIVCREGLVAPAMERARLECALDRFLQIAGRRHDGRVEAVSRQRRGARATCEGIAVIE